MKVFVGIVDRQTGISQYGMIDEPIQKGFEIANALGHFGVNISDVEWTISDITDNYKSKFGIVKETTKMVSVIII